MKYIKSFKTDLEYENSKASADFLTPNVGYIEDTKEVKYLNSKKDLYDIYGAVDLTSGQNSPSIYINNSSLRPEIFEDGHFGLNYNGQPTSLSFVQYSVTGGVKKYLTIDKIGIDTSNLSSFSVQGLDRLTALNLDGVNTSNFASFKHMFANCSGLTSLDLSGFDTSNATNMEGMFSGCISLSEIDVSNFVTSGVTNIKEMFHKVGCQSLDLSNFNTSNVTQMNNLFGSRWYGSKNLVSVNISNWDLSSVTDIQYMFMNTKLATLTMNNTNQTTFDMIKTQLVTDYRASYVTIIRDGVNWKYQNGAWVEV